MACSDRVVTLSGKVASEAKERIPKDASFLAGFEPIVSRIEVDPLI